MGGLEIKAWLIKEPDLTLNDLCDRYAKHFGISMGKSSMDRALKRMNLRYKKSPYDPNKYSDRTKPLKIDYCATIADIPQDKLIFLDEMGVRRQTCVFMMKPPLLEGNVLVWLER